MPREKCHGSSRPDPHETRISRVTRIVAGRVGLGQEDFKYHGSGRMALIRSAPRKVIESVKSLLLSLFTLCGLDDMLIIVYRPKIDEHKSNRGSIDPGKQ